MADVSEPAVWPCLLSRHDNGMLRDKNGEVKTSIIAGAAAILGALGTYALFAGWVQGQTAGGAVGGIIGLSLFTVMILGWTSYKEWSAKRKTGRATLERAQPDEIALGVSPARVGYDVVVRYKSAETGGAGGYRQDLWRPTIGSVDRLAHHLVQHYQPDDGVHIEVEGMRSAADMPDRRLSKVWLRVRADDLCRNEVPETVRAWVTERHCDATLFWAFAIDSTETVRSVLELSQLIDA